VEKILRLGVLDTPSSDLETFASDILFRHLVSITDFIEIQRTYNSRKMREEYEAFLRSQTTDAFAYTLAFSAEEALMDLERKLKERDSADFERFSIPEEKVGSIVATILGSGATILAPENKPLEAILACLRKGRVALFEAFWKIKGMEMTGRGGAPIVALMTLSPSGKFTSESHITIETNDILAASEELRRLGLALHPIYS